MLQGSSEGEEDGGLQLGTVCAKKGSGTQPNKGVKKETLEMPRRTKFFFLIDIDIDTDIFYQSVGE